MFFLGSTNVSPPAESIFLGASQGGGPCGAPVTINPIPPFFVVSLFAVNNIVELHTYIEGTAESEDSSSGISVQLQVEGFQDANGNAIAATLVPEPGTSGMFVLGLLGVAMVKFRSGLRFES